MANFRSSAPKRGNIRQEITSRFFRFFLLMILVGALLIFAEYRIIFIRGNELREEAKNTYIKERSVDAPEEISILPMEVCWQLLFPNIN